MIHPLFHSVFRLARVDYVMTMCVGCKGDAGGAARGPTQPDRAAQEAAEQGGQAGHSVGGSRGARIWGCFLSQAPEGEQLAQRYKAQSKTMMPEIVLMCCSGL